MIYFLAFSIVLAIVYLIIPIFKRLAVRINFVDKPTERKKHKDPIPLLGGVGIFTGFVCGYLIFIRPIDTQFISILAASFLILAIGLFDDWFKSHGKEFPVMPRLAVHITSAIIVFNSGIAFRGLTNPFTGEYITLPPYIQFTLTIIWLFGVTTVINWSDGMDGLAGSLTSISASTLFIVALAMHQPHSAMMSIITVGAVLGFLKYNRHPAQIYMGDSGANTLGFILGIIALEGAFKQATVISLFIPILALGVPIFDNILVVVRRFLRGIPIYKADASQIHHRLLSSGLSTKQTVAFLSLVNVCFCLFSIIIMLLKL